MTSGIPFLRQVHGLVSGHRLLVLAVISISLLSSVTEGLGVGLVIPLLEDPQGTESFVHGLPLVGDFTRFFNSLTVVDRVRFAALALAIIVLLQSGLRYACDILVLRLQVRVERDLKQSAFRQLCRVPLNFINSRPDGEFITILGAHTQRSARVVSTVVSATVSFSILIVYTALMLVISWRLTVAATVLLVVLTVVNRKTSAAKLSTAGREQKLHQEKMRAIMVESLAAMKLFHLYAQEPRVVEQFRKSMEQYLDHF